MMSVLKMVKNAKSCKFFKIVINYDCRDMMETHVNGDRLIEKNASKNMRID